ncbi:MAG: cytochrome c maturation protein CcmE [Gemmatimonadota bacterium]|nr:cytochrome c maturation protein CcmE [Gemmatimonadota bacterium]MDH5803859.1 cytochrome c maturation protein CcmE [Gemmatimonadota bacterium]
MTPKTKFIFGASLIAVSVGFLMAEGIKDTGVYFLTPTELAQRAVQDSSLFAVGVRIGGNVVKGSITRDIASQTITFDVTDGETILPVIYQGFAPDTFTDEVEVVVEGRYRMDGTVQATDVMAKCGSRYEAIPEMPAT